MKITIISYSFFLALSLLLFPFNKVFNSDLSADNYSAKHARIEENKTKENPYYIIISKKAYELKVYDDLGWFATYPCVFGSNDLGDKFMEGDKKTPEGNFKVLIKKNNAKWKFELLLDYPNPESIQKFNQRVAAGQIPRNAKIGSGIAIHATRPQEEWTVDYFQNWTDGCISLKYSEAEDLFSYIPVGTPVTITK
jgi:murein L,D-transpeptidase YafK